MKKLLAFMNRLDKTQRLAFCLACGTTEGYLRKAISLQQRLGGDLCINIDRESKAEITCEDLRPDVDWSYIRSTARTKPESEQHVD